MAYTKATLINSFLLLLLLLGAGRQFPLGASRRALGRIDFCFFSRGGGGGGVGIGGGGGGGEAPFGGGPFWWGLPWASAQSWLHACTPSGGLRPRLATRSNHVDLIACRCRRRQWRWGTVLIIHHLLPLYMGSTCWTRRLHSPRSSRGCTNSRIGPTWDNPKLRHFDWSLSRLADFTANQNDVIWDCPP